MIKSSIAHLLMLSNIFFVAAVASFPEQARQKVSTAAGRGDLHGASNFSGLGAGKIIGQGVIEQHQPLLLQNATASVPAFRNEFNGVADQAIDDFTGQGIIVVHHGHDPL